jgi:hypothetical protein
MEVTERVMTDRCEACGAILGLEFRRAERSEGLFCGRCDWSVATNFFSAVDVDETEYKVHVSGGDPHNGLHVAAIAKVSGQGFAAARHLLHDTDPVVFTGRALDVLKVREALKEAGLQMRTAPPFPHTD